MSTLSFQIRCKDTRATCQREAGAFSTQTGVHVKQELKDIKHHEQELKQSKETRRMLKSFQNQLLAKYGYEELEKYVNEHLTYQSYKRSDMWRVISRLKREIVRCCEICGIRYGLQAHHLTYEHLGLEAFHMDDLQVLCDSCHRRAHGILYNLPYYTVREVLMSMWPRLLLEENQKKVQSNEVV